MTSEKAGIHFIVAVVAIVALAGLTFALAGPVAGLIVIVCLVVGFFIGRSRVERERGPVEVAAAPADDVTRLLVIAHEGLGDENLVGELTARAEGETHVHVVVPALASTADRLAGDQAAVDAASADLERLVGRLRGGFSRVDGEIGDSDPTVALEDALRTFPADEVIVVNPPADRKGQLEEAATRRAKEDVPLRVTELNLG